MAENAPGAHEVREAITEEQTNERLCKDFENRLSKALEEATPKPDFDSAANIAEIAKEAIEQNRETIKTVAEIIGGIALKIKEVTESATFYEVKKAVKGINAFLNEYNEVIQEAHQIFSAAPEPVQDLFPFLFEAFADGQGKPPLDEASLADVITNGFDKSGNPIETSPYFPIIQRAKELKAEYDSDSELEKEFEKLEKSIPLLQSIIPQNHTMPNNALMNTLEQKPAINEGAFDMVVANERGRRKEITAYTVIDYDPGETGITITDARLTEYERQVSDAVVSLWEEAKKQNLPPVFTTDMIYRSMPGGGDKASPAQKGAITRTLEKFRRLHITVDATEEMQRRGIKGKDGKPIKSLTFDNFYLTATHAEYKVSKGGQTVNAYRIESEPIILTYSKLTSQLLTVPAKYIEIKKVKSGNVTTELVTMTEKRQAMTGYMLRRISIMKRDAKNKSKHQSHTILFDTLFREAGTTTTDRKQTGLNRNFCFDVLDYWKATGFIKDYQKQTKGRSITGIEICL